ncbi:MAG: CPBP family intramembrane glutamic endopeptidase [Bacteroidota bacterium]
MLKRISDIIHKTFDRTESESVAYRTTVLKNRTDRKIIWVAVISAVSLVFIEYIGKAPGYLNLIVFLKSMGINGFSGFLSEHLGKTGNVQLNRLIYWICIVVIFYLVIPILVVKVVLREKLSDYGIRFGNIKKDYGIYMVMLVIMIPLVYWMSTTHSFQLRYPFYELKHDEPLYPNFWIWEAMYFVQFIGVEFFFRGFMLHGSRRQLGFYSIFFMVIPYCMIHFGKPMAETFAAIVAGIALGILSLKSRSIVPGILIHYSVAIAMDFAALYQKGYF